MPTKKEELREVLESIAPLDDVEKSKPKETLGGGRKMRKKGKREPWSKRKKIIVWSIVAFFSILLIIGGVIAAYAFHNGGKIFQGSMTDFLTKREPLQRDEHGRSNIVIFGTSEDEQGDASGYLTDSIIILSVNQDTSVTNMMSIPRDLWVTYEDSCTFGNEGKINAVFLCKMQQTQDDEDASAHALQRKLTEVTGLDVQYYARMNNTVIRDTVDALGGVDVEIASRDPRGIYDINTKIQFTNGTHHIDGDTAMRLSRARNAKGGYGLERSNFDREKNQRAIIKAVQTKALSTGTLANPTRVIGLLDSMGENVHTNIQGSELQTVISVAQGINPNALETIAIGDSENNLLQTGMYGDQSIVRPVLGLLDYAGIREFILQHVRESDAAAEEEAATESAAADGPSS